MEKEKEEEEEVWSVSDGVSEDSEDPTGSHSLFISSSADRDFAKKDEEITTEEPCR